MGVAHHQVGALAHPFYKEGKGLLGDPREDQGEQDLGDAMLNEVQEVGMPTAFN